MEALIGHCTQFGLVNRDHLSIWYCTSAFIAQCYDYPTSVWQSVNEELAAFRGAMTFAVTTWVTPWSPMVYACDSSLEGHSVQCSLWALSDFREPGLGKEGSRWKLGGAEWARLKSLEVAGCLVGENGNLERDAEVCYSK